MTSLLTCFINYLCVFISTLQLKYAQIMQDRNLDLILFPRHGKPLLDMTVHLLI